RAVAFPEDEGAVEDLLFVVAAQVFLRVPQTHLCGGVEARGRAGVTAKVLVGQEQDFDLFAFFQGRVPAGQGPVEDGIAVGGSAHRPAVHAAEGLDRGGGVHVADRDDAVGGRGRGA